MKKEDKKELTEKYFKELEEKLELAKKERDEYLNGWKRAKADLANFKKEMIASMGELSFAARAQLIIDILPVADSLDEAAKNNIEGLDNIYSLLTGILKKEGIKEIFPKEGEVFNPEFHEAVGGEGDKVSEVMQKGYKYEDKVLRPAKVKVSKE